MKRLLVQLLFTPLPLTAVIMLVVKFGALRAAPPELANLTVCALPCWNQIIPGMTSMEEAHHLLIGAGYQVRRGPSFRSVETVYNAVGSLEPCEIWLTRQANTVEILWLRYCSEVRLGSIMALIGTPEGILTGSSSGQYLLYAGTRVNVQTDYWAWSDADSPIRSIVISPEPRATSNNIYPWHGFVLRWRYCQLESAPDCD